MHYNARVFWQKKVYEPFTDNRYSRAHRWSFDGGIEVPASASPQVVPLPLSEEHAVDPEEAFVAALSSCQPPENIVPAKNAPSYVYNGENRLTFNPHGKGFFRLVFHFGARFSIRKASFGINRLNKASAAD